MACVKTHDWLKVQAICAFSLVLVFFMHGIVSLQWHCLLLFLPAPCNFRKEQNTYWSNQKFNFKTNQNEKKKKVGGGGFHSICIHIWLHGALIHTYTLMRFAIRWHCHWDFFFCYSDSRLHMLLVYHLLFVLLQLETCMYQVTAIRHTNTDINKSVHRLWRPNMLNTDTITKLLYKTWFYGELNIALFYW